MKRSTELAKPAKTLAEYYWRVQAFNAARTSERWVERALANQSKKVTK